MYGNIKLKIFKICSLIIGLFFYLIMNLFIYLFDIMWNFTKYTIIISETVYKMEYLLLQSQIHEGEYII